MPSMARRFQFSLKWLRPKGRRHWTLIDTLCLLGVLFFALELALPLIQWLRR